MNDFDDVDILEPDVLPKKRQPKMPQDNKPKNDKERELARKVLKFNLDVMTIGRQKPATVEELEDRFITYFEKCVNEGMPPTIEGLALVSGWCRSTFYDIAAGKVNVQFSDIAQKAKDYVCNYDASMASIGKVNAPIYIFRAKNFYDMRDVQEVKAGPIQDPTKPKNEQEIIDILPECPTQNEVIDLPINEEK